MSKFETFFENAKNSDDYEQNAHVIEYLALPDIERVQGKYKNFYTRSKKRFFRLHCRGYGKIA